MDVVFPGVSVTPVQGQKYSIVMRSADAALRDITLQVSFFPDETPPVFTLNWPGFPVETQNFPLNPTAPGGPDGFRFLIDPVAGTITGDYSVNAFWSSIRPLSLGASTQFAAPRYVIVDSDAGLRGSYTAPQIVDLSAFPKGTLDQLSTDWRAQLLAFMNPVSQNLPGVAYFQSAKYEKEDIEGLANASWMLLWRWISGSSKNDPPGANNAYRLNRKVSAALAAYVDALTNPVHATFASGFADHAPYDYNQPFSSRSNQALSLRLISSLTYVPTPNPRPDPTPTPQSLVFQVDAPNNPNQTDDSQELYRHISGFAVLLRSQGRGAWRCLNATRIVDYVEWAVAQRARASRCTRDRYSGRLGILVDCHHSGSVDVRRAREKRRTAPLRRESVKCE